jgi:prepilin-type processing-associated H-X9-DG protein
LENQGQEANFVFVDGEISLPHNPEGIVPEKTPYPESGTTAL